MIPWYVPRAMTVPEADRCVNEGDPACAGRAQENGWCGPCWASIVPPGVEARPER